MASDTLDWYYREPELATEVTHPLARVLRESRASLTYRWLERIEDRIEVGEDQVFPSQEILDHVPLLITAIADFLEDPAEEGPAADEVIAKATELGEMRFEQGFSSHQVLKEFEILGGVLLACLRTTITEIGFTPDPDQVVVMAHRVYRALAKIQQATAARYIALLEGQRSDVDQRLRAVRALVEDLLEQQPEPSGEEAGGIGGRGRLEARLRNLRELTFTGQSSRRAGVPLAGAVKEAVRRVRPIARDAELELRVAEPLPDIKVPDAQIELCLVAYLTNAIRHCQITSGHCHIEVAAQAAEGGEVTVTVRNTGRQVEATDDITELAEVEKDPVRGERGVGLRLARDLIGSLGGRTWVEPVQDPAGALFGMALPSRRSDDAAEPDDARP